MASILLLKESEVAKFIIEHFGSDIFKVLEINANVKILYEAQGIVEKGDLDLLIINPDAVQETILIECKRIKVEIKQDQSEKVNKIEDIKKLVGQVNNRVKSGFHKVYLTVLIVCDGRNKIANNILFNHASNKTLESIYSHPYLEKLNPKAGILFLEPSQLTAKDYNQEAGCGIYVMRKPTAQTQQVELTKRIELVLNGKNVH